MTQGRLDLQGGEPLLVVYAIDTSTLMWLDGLNLEPDQSRRFEPQESALIWDGLDRLASQGCLKTIRMVREELADNDREALERIASHGRKTLAPAVTNRTRAAFRSVVAQFPNVINPDWKRDPADPWIVAYAETYGYTVITDELPARLHASRRNQRRTFIPDMCDGRTPPVPWTSLRDLASREGWLPA